MPSRYSSIWSLLRLWDQSLISTSFHRRSWNNPTACQETFPSKRNSFFVWDSILRCSSDPKFSNRTVLAFERVETHLPGDLFSRGEPSLRLFWCSKTVPRVPDQSSPDRQRQNTPCQTASRVAVHPMRAFAGCLGLGRVALQSFETASIQHAWFIRAVRSRFLRLATCV